MAMGNYYDINSKYVTLVICQLCKEAEAGRNIPN
jgi:hypothetical protein